MITFEHHFINNWHRYHTNYADNQNVDEESIPQE